jgi:hypothetical protein
MLLIVTGTSGIGKSTLSARLAGTVPGAIVLDADLFAEDLASVTPPNHDYPAFWRSMMRLAHELGQNGADAIVYFATMLPDQVLVNHDVLSYFAAARFLCLTCSPDALTARLTRRDPDAPGEGVRRWVEFNDTLAALGGVTPEASVLDASGTTDEVEAGVRHWVQAHLHDTSGNR